jgi:hypothetical protein
MTNYHQTLSKTVSSLTISQDVAARKAARRKIIEKAHKIERDSYKAMMERRRRLQTRYNLSTIV